MTNNARRCHHDAKYALQQLEAAKTLQEKRVYWHACMSLLYTTKEALWRLDFPRGHPHHSVYDARYTDVWLLDPHFDFFKDERDRIEHLDRAPLSRHQYGLSVATKPGLGGSGLGGAGLSSASFNIVEGHFKGRDASEVASECVEWFEGQLTDLEKTTTT